jgi:hypothetical protein
MGYVCETEMRRPSARLNELCTPHCRPISPRLPRVVSVQRSLYKRIEDRTGKSNTTLTGDRIQKLNDMDFEWVARDHRTVPWEARYQELVAFVRRYGHSQVPIGWEVSTTSDRKLTPNDSKPPRSPFSPALGLT